jgi:hypothetical protein
MFEKGREGYYGSGRWTLPPSLAGMFYSQQEFAEYFETANLPDRPHSLASSAALALWPDCDPDFDPDLDPVTDASPEVFLRYVPLCDLLSEANLRLADAAPMLIAWSEG